MFDSSTVYDNTPLLSRQFITTTYRSRFRFCTPKVFFKTLRGCLAEFLAMTILMFVSAMTARNTLGDKSTESILTIAIGNGFLYGVLVAATMQIRYAVNELIKPPYCYPFCSAGFLNPAVTIGVMLAGVLNPISGLCYILMQLLGAIAGAGIVSVSISCFFDALMQILYTLYKLFEVIYSVRSNYSERLGNPS